MHTCEKNHLKRPKIKQGITSKLNCILFNRLLSPVLLNKSGLAQAKAVNFNSNILNKCFSNYYQLRTWLVFCMDSHINYVTGSEKTHLSGIFYISRNTNLKYFSHCGSFLLESSYIKFTASVE